MATTTPNFGWPVPTSSDLVKNGATAIEALGDAIDASLMDLEGGTTDQVLAKNSNTDMDFKWVTPSSGSTFVGARVVDTAAQSINNATYTALTWDTESYDTDAFHSTSSNTSRFTIPAGKGGKYLLNCQMIWQSSSNTGARTISLYKNGAIILEREFSLSTRGNLSMAIDSVQNAVATDYFEIFVYQTNGSAINADKTSAYSEFSISYLGA